MSTSAEELVSACFDELRLSQRFVPYIGRAEEAGYPHLAKLFRALVASETAREALFRKSIPHHADQACDFYVCPYCGLIYDLECPDQCVADQTPGAEFIVFQ
jgi:rubrerythrin